MVAMGQETTLTSKLVTGVQPSTGEEDPTAYVSGIQERLREVHRWVVPMATPTRPNSYELAALSGSLLLPRENLQALAQVARALSGDQGP